ncbi:MAG: RNA polymerase recycling motor HelD [Bacillaceae bacterium]
MSNWEQDLKNEQERVDEVSRKVSEALNELQQRVGSVKTEIIHLRKNFWEDVKVNIDTMEDAIETLANMKQQSELLTEREQTHRHTYNQSQLLEKLKETPYFGRIDFQEKTEPVADEIYLGIGSFYDKETERFLVYDWRAPISSLYYDYGLGHANYEAPEGTISGELLLKRQYIIRNGQIRSMFDTGVTIGDELLQEVLGRNANAQMKSIVATIQREQNQIIRNEGSQLVIVQGAAGSGKTSAALQRVAYLLYRYRNTLSSDQILLFSPNPMFNSYISNVLPELGEENTQQTTFQDYVEHMVGNTFDVEDPFAQLEYILTANQGEDYQTRIAGIQYKSSAEFMNFIDNYVAELSNKGLIFKPIKFRGRILISSQSIYEYFYQLDSSISIPNRLQLVTKWIVKNLKGLEKREVKKEWVEHEIQYLGKEEYTRFYQKLMKEQRFSEDTFDDFDREQQLLMKYVVQKKFKPLYKRVKQLKYVNMSKLFTQMFEDVQHGSLVPNNWSEICEQTICRVKEKQLAYEDATPYLYLKECLEGFKRNYLVKFVFIDEAQDYSPFQIAFIKQLFPKAKWTLLGDINQTIFSHGSKESLQTITTLFADQKIETFRLQRSYRSTRQIVEFTKHILTNDKEIEAFNRDGNKPLCLEAPNEKALVESVIKRVKDLQHSGFKTIAIICKTAKESEEVAQSIGDRLDFRLIKKESGVYERGIVVIPAYLAKGIEFDAVIIFDGSVEKYGKESEQNLFYTACTRAMHELSIYYVGEITPFLSAVPQELFGRK